MVSQRSSTPRRGSLLRQEVPRQGSILRFDLDANVAAPQVPRLDAGRPAAAHGVEDEVAIHGERQDQIARQGVREGGRVLGLAGPRFRRRGGHVPDRSGALRRGDRPGFVDAQAAVSLPDCMRTWTAGAPCRDLQRLLVPPPRPRALQEDRNVLVIDPEPRCPPRPRDPCPSIDDRLEEAPPRVHPRHDGSERRPCLGEFDRLVLHHHRGDPAVGRHAQQFRTERSEVDPASALVQPLVVVGWREDGQVNQQVAHPAQDLHAVPRNDPVVHGGGFNVGPWMAFSAVPHHEPRQDRARGRDARVRVLHTVSRVGRRRAVPLQDVVPDSAQWVGAEEGKPDGQ